MRVLALVLLLVCAPLLGAQDFLGRWSVVRVFTTGDVDRTVDHRLMLMVEQAPRGEFRAPGVVDPVGLTLEFSVSPSNKAQHITLASQGQLWMSLNWKSRDPGPGSPDTDPSLKVWNTDEADYGVYTILLSGPRTLVFTDRSRIGSQYLDIYQLERAP